MLRSFYIAGTGMITQRQKMNVIINNITNVDTTGYKYDQLVTQSFPDMLLSRLQDPAYTANAPYVGPQDTGVHIDEISTDWGQGPMQETDEQTDFAILGQGFFCVDTPQGVQYTRAGDFTVDANGMLLTQEGYYVLGTNGQRLNVGTNGFTVQLDGTIRTAEGANAGTIRIVTTENLDNMEKVGNNNWLPFNGAVMQNVANPQVQQGMLEGSNVDVGRVTSDMLVTQRAYESSQRMLRMVDQSLSRAVNDITSF